MKPSNKNELKGKMHAMKGAVKETTSPSGLGSSIWIGAILLIGVIVAIGKLASAGSKASLQTVSRVDLARYVGRWYEIARYPTRFEESCVSDVTAIYTPLSGGKIEVLNECRKADGQVRRSKGTARVVDENTNAKLKVTFFWPFSGNYWIIDLAPDYSYAVVGEPDRKYLWILSRSPQLTESVYGDIITHVRELGYDPSGLMKTPQSSR
jgi:apolipoprotein D and lipocalin family protein